MLYYFTKSGARAQDAAEMIADGKKHFRIWTGNGAAFDYDAAGNMIGRVDDAPRHFDAVEIWTSMPEKDRKNAHRIAAGRETIRSREEKAESILRMDVITAADRAALLSLVSVSYHDSGKIEGCFSVDSTAACDFCEKMRAAALDNVLIICGACYAAADSYKEFSWRAHKLNARILSMVLFSVDEMRALKIDGERCRLNEDGDTINITHARNYLRIIAGRKSTHFGYWYKNRPAVEGGLRAEGYTRREDLPDNVRFIHSSLLIGVPAEPTWFDDGIFTVYPDAATTAAAIAAGAHACNGRRCRACGFTCYMMKRRPEPLYIAEFLRCGAAARARIMTAYNAYTAAQAARA